MKVIKQLTLTLNALNACAGDFEKGVFGKTDLVIYSNYKRYRREKMAICKTKTDTIIKPPEWAENQPAWLRLEDQLTWYDKKSSCAQRWYKWLKFIQVVLAISIPIVSQIYNEGKWLASIAGGLIAIIEAVHHMNQYSTLWITYRSTAERLKH